MKNWFALVITAASLLSHQVAYGETINSRNIGVIVNRNDQQSVEVARYYQRQRNIRDENIIYVAFDAENSVASKDEFLPVLEEIRTKTASHIKGYVVTWTKPYRVGCMSITSAIAMGYDEKKYCARGCRLTDKSEYFDLASNDAISTVKPTMMLAGENLELVKALIDRGVSADFTRPSGDVYLLSTSDKSRNVRSVDYRKIQATFGELLHVEIINSDFIKNRKNVFLYFTGVSKVRHLESLSFLPGAVADHLTSTGGDLFETRQMSSLEWLKAGATGSYGNVVEPCNFTSKFPHPGIFMHHYLDGDSLIDAYWKSVLMPGQGIFVGEPLARPFGGCQVRQARSGDLLLNNRKPEGFLMRSAANCLAGHKLNTAADD